MYKRNLTLVAKLCMLAPAYFLAAGVFASQEGSSVAAVKQTSEPAQGAALNSTMSNDFNEPVFLDSKSQALDGKKKTSIFTDNVVITQGSLELLADRVELDATAGKRKEIIMASGNPASYQQRKDDGSLVIARANEIIYSVESRTISLKGSAYISQNEINVTGDSIVFDMAKEQILASTDDGSQDSVRTVLSPGAFSDTDKKEKNDDASNQAVLKPKSDTQLNLLQGTN